MSSEIPVNVDWPQVFFNIKRKANLSLLGTAHAAHVDYAVVRKLNSELGRDSLFTNGARVLNLHLKLMPDVPIPQKGQP